MNQGPYPHQTKGYPAAPVVGGHYLRPHLEAPKKLTTGSGEYQSVWGPKPTLTALGGELGPTEEGL